jgi:hypothetical protein
MELDSRDVRWKSGFYFGDSDLPEDLMREAIGSSLFFIKQHILGLVKLSIGKSLGEALKSIGEEIGEGVIFPVEGSA